MKRRLLIAMTVALVPALLWAVDTLTHMNGTRQVVLSAPATWEARTEPYVVSASAPSEGDAYPPTVSVLVEAVSGERKRLQPYMKAMYSLQWQMSDAMTGWSPRDTTWDGLPASVSDFRSAYGDAMMNTRVIVAIEGDTAYVCRAMWLDDTSPTRIASALEVLSTVKRPRSTK
ncbi:MAG: hypothetical protein FGM24_02940 [Candidatus Kapabacteria bacterium]|nr:hypothetical protein [Candidatus Kapabacteria bacterium]